MTASRRQLALLVIEVDHGVRQGLADYSAFSFPAPSRPDKREGERKGGALLFSQVAVPETVSPGLPLTER